MRAILIVIGCALALAACGSAASPGQPAPAQIQVTPGVQQTSIPSTKPAGGGYDGY